MFFAHANGFVARSYQYFFDQMPQHNIGYINAFGHNTYPVTRHWKLLVQELITAIEQRYANNPTVGVGHSLGGVLTLFAAIERPDLFSKIILLDPPLFSANKRTVIAILKKLNLLQYIPPASLAKKRRTNFNSKDEALQYFSSKSLFRNFHPQCLQHYIDYGLKPDGNNAYTLSFSNTIEQAVFEYLPTTFPKKALQIPAHYFYSTHFKILSKKDVAATIKYFNFTHTYPIDAGHLFPLEIPHKTAQLINRIVN